MSEHQVYELLALDRPLTSKQMAQLRAISSRATITPTRFYNEYNWGDLKADPVKLLAKYFDAFCYHANWGSRRLMFRVPRERVSEGEIREYVSTRAVGSSVLIDFELELEDSFDADEISLIPLFPLRAELVRGDLRAPYIGWLSSIQWGNIDNEAEEPPVPAGLKTPTEAQRALIEFLRIDPALAAEAAKGSASAERVDPKSLRAWIGSLDSHQKDSWLLRAMQTPDLNIGDDLLRAFGKATASAHKVWPAPRRAGELRAALRTPRRRVDP